MFCFFKQKTAYEVRISDWSSDVCSSDLRKEQDQHHALPEIGQAEAEDGACHDRLAADGVGLQAGQHAERHAEEDGDEQRQEGQLQGGRQLGEDEAERVGGMDEASAEVGLRRVRHEDEEQIGSAECREKRGPYM